MKYLIVIDVQNDFVFGSLGSAEAQAMLPKLMEKVRNFEGTVIFTKDTHGEDYSNTQEGRLLPVSHCIRDTEGWELPQELQKLAEEKQAKIYCKPTFGSVQLADDMQKLGEQGLVERIELVGICTDICVVSNAMLIKAMLPEVPLYVDASCCAGVSPEKHEAALSVMESSQIIVKR